LLQLFGDFPKQRVDEQQLPRKSPKPVGEVQVLKIFFFANKILNQVIIFVKKRK